MAEYLLDDVFQITAVDPDGRKFDRVSRAIGRTEQQAMEVLLDMATDLYPVANGDRFMFVLTRTLALDGSLHDHVYTLPKSAGGPPTPNLADKFEYVMFGRVYKCEDIPGATSRMAVYMSFGGLILRLEGESRNLDTLGAGLDVYLLMKRIL